MPKRSSWGAARLALLQHRRLAPLAGDPATLPLGATAPHAVVDLLGQGVLEAGTLHGTTGADRPGDLYADAVAGEEHARRDVPTEPSFHPVGVHSGPLIQRNPAA